jgi:hypothetical protein
MSRILFCLTALFFFHSCEEPVDVSHFWDCHHADTWTEESLKEFLVGDWTWVQQTCYLGADSEEHEGQIVSFSESGVVVSYEPGAGTHSAHYEVRGTSEVYFLELDAYIPGLHGQILICGNRLALMNSVLDGCDSEFERN